MVGRRHMGMGADTTRLTAVAEKTPCLLLAGRFAVKIDHDGVSRLAQQTGFQFAFDRCEGIVGRLHEHATDRVDDERALAALGSIKAAPRPGA